MCRIYPRVSLFALNRLHTPSQDTCSWLGMSKKQLEGSNFFSHVSRPAAPKTYPVVSPLVIPLATPERGCL